MSDKIVPSILYIRPTEKSKADVKEDLDKQDSPEKFNKLIAEAESLNGNTTGNDRTTGSSSNRKSGGSTSI